MLYEVITRRVVRKEVREGSTVMPGTPLLVLDRSGKPQVRAEIGEAWAGKIEPGQALTVEIPALEKRFTAKVADVLPAADPRSRSFQITLELPRITSYNVCYTKLLRGRASRSAAAGWPPG